MMILKLLVEQLDITGQVNTIINAKELQYIVDHYSIYASKQEGIPDHIF
jgi:hypothetical protein